MKYLLLLVLFVIFHIPIFAQWNSIQSGTFGTLNEVEFIDDSIGFIAGTSGILKTIDQGNSWTLTSQTINGSAINFPSDSIGYCIDNYKNVLRTDNQGDSWSVVNSFQNLNLNSVHFVSENIGYIAAHIQGPVQSYIMKTLDGGSTWDLDSFPNIPTLQDIHFLNSDTGFVCGYGGKVIKTYNGGASWDIVQSEKFETLISLHFYNNQIGCAVGYSSFSGHEVVITSNLGIDWLKINSNGTINNALRSVHFPSADTVYAVGENGRIIFSLDAGNTWTISYSGITNDLYSVFFISSDVGIAVGGGGKIIKTNNGTYVSTENPIPVQKELKIFPNPTDLSGDLTISSHISITKIQIVDELGKVVYYIDHPISDNIVIPNDILKSGIYFISITNNQGLQHNEKLIVK